MDKDTKRLLAAAEAQGFVVRMTSKGHALVSTADGRPVTTFAGTPSDWRSAVNSLRALQRTGFQWPQPGKGR